ncbi:MAG: SRPBCC family protein [Acidobacteria bacterium]|nr:SRPBCC family protein [Acidobacteriota bacterium]
MLLERTTFIPATIDRVFAFFSDPRNLARLTPSSLGLTVLSAPMRELRQGDEVEYRIRVMGIPVRWVTQIVSWHHGRSFEDLQKKGPYAFWLHLHEFTEVEGGVRMVDRIEYRVPFGALGWAVTGWFVGPRLQRIFDFRTIAMAEVFPGTRQGDGA